MKIVKFKNGKYGIRKWGWADLKYIFISKNNYWWHTNDDWFKTCQHNKEEALEIYNLLTDQGTPVKQGVPDAPSRDSMGDPIDSTVHTVHTL